MSLRQDVTTLKALAPPERARRFRFGYGNYGDQAELVLVVPAHWDSQVPPAVSMIALSGNWTGAGPLPDSSLGKEMLRAAERATGLKLSYGKTWVSTEDGAATRPVRLAATDFSLVQALLPTYAQA